MTYTTRFNPTANGGLHLGHVYMAEINRAIARETGGKFHVRWDDSNPPYLVWGRERLNAICVQQRAELEWLGFAADSWTQQHAIIDEVHEEMTRRGWRPMADENPVYLPEYITEPMFPLYPCTPKLTAEKVVMDWMAGINLLVRGIDLMTEYGMYQYYCRLFDLPQPRHVYLPRVRNGAGDISKSGGTNGSTIAEMQAAGYEPEYVRKLVAVGCLRYWYNGWHLENIKPEPRL